MSPVTGAAFAVRDAYDEDVIGFDGVEHGLRKHPRSTEMNILFKNAPTLRTGNDLGDGRSDYLGEALAQCASPLFVELNGLLEFRERFRMELVPHFASRRSMRR